MDNVCNGNRVKSSMFPYSSNTLIMSYSEGFSFIKCLIDPFYKPNSYIILITNLHSSAQPSGAINYHVISFWGYFRPPPHTLMWHLTRRGLYQCLMLDYAHRCRTSTLIMVSINFWQNSDPFKNEEHFSSSKIDRLRAFFINLSNFQ